MTIQQRTPEEMRMEKFSTGYNWEQDTYGRWTSAEFAMIRLLTEIRDLLRTQKPAQPPKQG